MDDMILFSGIWTIYGDSDYIKANIALYAYLLVEGASNQTWDELWNLITQPVYMFW
jgi:hypothetical protein